MNKSEYICNISCPFSYLIKGIYFCKLDGMECDFVEGVEQWSNRANSTKTSR